MNAVRLLPALRDLYSRAAGTRHRRPREPRHVLSSLGHTGPSDEAEIAASVAVARGVARSGRPQRRAV